MNDEAELGLSLDEVWLGDTRLKVQKPKFGREEKPAQLITTRREVAGGRG